MRLPDNRSVRSAEVLRPNVDQRKSEILEAAVQVIIDVGFTEMTVADVASRTGDPARGESRFMASCSTCHRRGGGPGTDVGPDLAAIADSVVLLTTFALTVVIDLTVAIGVGMVLAVFLFMKRMAETTEVEAVSNQLRELRSEDRLEAEAGEPRAEARHARVPRDVEVYDINGPFFFGAAEKFRDALAQIHRKPRALILDMENVPVIDSTVARLSRLLPRLGCSSPSNSARTARERSSSARASS